MLAWCIGFKFNYAENNTQIGQTVTFLFTLVTY